MQNTNNNRQSKISRGQFLKLGFFSFLFSLLGLSMINDKDSKSRASSGYGGGSFGA